MVIEKNASVREKEREREREGEERESVCVCVCEIERDWKSVPSKRKIKSDVFIMREVL
jgi:hypothetical protein